MSRKILICYLVQNSGHHAAAKALEMELKRQDPDVETRCLDLLETTHPYWSRFVQQTYMSTIRRTPELWAALYDNLWFDLLTRYLRPLVQRGNSKKFLRLMDEFQPDTVICTQAHPFAVIASYIHREKRNIQLWGIITDYMPHRFWALPDMNLKNVTYVVPTETAEERLMLLGIPEEKIHVFGIPIRPDVVAVRNRQVSRENQERRVLVMGGSRGLGAKYRTVRALDRSPADFTIDVITGSNKTLRKKLVRKRKTFKHHIRIRGFVQDAMAVMHRASILISKPGGMTSAEATATGLPMILIRPLPGQESGNTETLVRNGAAIHLQRDQDLPRIVTNLLTHPALLRRMGRRAMAMGKPAAAQNIIQAVLGTPHNPSEKER